VKKNERNRWAEGGGKRGLCRTLGSLSPPEKLSKRKETNVAKLRVYQELCKGTDECGICLYACPKEVFKPSGELNPKGYRPPEVAKEEACTQCENCMIFCPDLAIAVSGEKDKKGVKR
jgi:2-oxoglutarate ferredoxin oxidoreductase subunit delta